MNLAANWATLLEPQDGDNCHHCPYQMKNIAFFSSTTYDHQDTENLYTYTVKVASFMVVSMQEKTQSISRPSGLLFVY
jgi:hypothetical protein